MEGEKKKDRVEPRGWSLKAPAGDALACGFCRPPGLAQGFGTR